MTLHTLSPHVQPVAPGDGRERRVQRHARGQQAASPSATGSDPECTFASVPPGPAAAGCPTATPALPGETLQGSHVHAHTHIHTHTHTYARIHTLTLPYVCRCYQRGQSFPGLHPPTQRRQKRSWQRPMTCRRMTEGQASTGAALPTANHWSVFVFMYVRYR